MGRLIPAGTGFRKYKKIIANIPEVEAEEESSGDMEPSAEETIGG